MSLLLALVRDIAAAELDDGLLVDCTTATAEIIRDDDEYAGVRVSMTCTLATARISDHVDANVGDPILPAPQEVLVPRELDPLREPPAPHTNSSVAGHGHAHLPATGARLCARRTQTSTSSGRLTPWP